MFYPVFSYIPITPHKDITAKKSTKKNLEIKNYALRFAIKKSLISNGGDD